MQWTFRINYPYLKHAGMIILVWGEIGWFVNFDFPSYITFAFGWYKSHFLALFFEQNFSYIFLGLVSTWSDRIFALSSNIILVAPDFNRIKFKKVSSHILIVKIQDTFHCRPFKINTKNEKDVLCLNHHLPLINYKGENFKHSMRVLSSFLNV